MKKTLILFAALFLYAQTPDTQLQDTNTSYQPLPAQNGNYIKAVSENFEDSYISISNKADIAVVINKKRFFKYIPSLMNALNAYYAQKGIDYKISLYGIDTNLSDINSSCILYFTTDGNNIAKLKDSPKTFLLPLINKNDTNVTAPNIYFGSIDLKNQIKTLTSFIDAKTDVITTKTIIAEKLLKYENNSTQINRIYRFPNIYYEDLNNSFVIFNTDAGQTAQVLSKITQKEIQTKLALTPQIGYDPLMIMLTQPADIEKLLIANSIIHTPLLINDYAMLLNSGIRYNWLNYASCILANKAYNMQNSEDEFYMSDFNIYIFDNQINYKTKLYKIINGAFRQVE
jgi:hypothetical protein